MGGFEGILKTCREAAKQADDIEQGIRHLVADAVDNRKRIAAITEMVRAMKDTDVIANVQPTMRRTVAFLRAMGLDTTDSGDGVANVQAGMEGSLAFPHVCAVVDGESALRRAEKLAATLREMLVPDNVSVEVAYSSKDGKTILTVLNLCDANLPDAARNFTIGEEP